jgi:hypothetical protein
VAMPAPAADGPHRYWHKFTISNFSWKVISAVLMKISAATDMEMMVQRHLNIGIYQRQLPDAISYKHCCSIDLYFTMSSNTGASILDEALACIGQRITFILVHPADKDQNYIASLCNEVVGIF